MPKQYRRVGDKNKPERESTSPETVAMYEAKDARAIRTAVYRDKLRPDRVVAMFRHKRDEQWIRDVIFYRKILYVEGER